MPTLPLLRRPATPILAVLLAALMLVAAPARAQGSTAPDSSATKQLELGEQWFRAVCFECHATGGLSSADFRLKWNGRSVYDLFESIRSTMPESDPGSLTQGTYAAVVAYLMKVNGMPVGTSAVPVDSAGLAAVKLTFAPAVSTLRR